MFLLIFYVAQIATKEPAQLAANSKRYRHPIARHNIDVSPGKGVLSWTNRGLNCLSGRGRYASKRTGVWTEATPSDSTTGFDVAARGNTKTGFPRGDDCENSLADVWGRTWKTHLPH